MFHNFNFFACSEGDKADTRDYWMWFFKIQLSLKLKEHSRFSQSARNKDKKFRIIEEHQNNVGIRLLQNKRKGKSWGGVIWHLKRIGGCVQGCFESAPFLDSRSEAEPGKPKLPAACKRTHRAPIGPIQPIQDHPKNSQGPHFSGQDDLTLNRGWVEDTWEEGE